MVAAHLFSYNTELCSLDQRLQSLKSCAHTKIPDTTAVSVILDFILQRLCLVIDSCNCWLSLACAIDCTLHLSSAYSGPIFWVCVHMSMVLVHCTLYHFQVSEFHPLICVINSVLI